MLFQKLWDWLLKQPRPVKAEKEARRRLAMWREIDMAYIGEANMNCPITVEMVVGKEDTTIKM